MRALAQEDVGEYLNRFFVASYQKVGTFRMIGNAKVGGNVAGYFCTAKGRVLHAVAGPVDGETFLQEARWVVESVKLAQLEDQDALPKLKPYFRTAHLTRLQREQAVLIDPRSLPPMTTALDRAKTLGKGMFLRVGRLLFGVNQNQLKVHYLLATYPLPKLSQVYRVVFEDILRERISINPIAQN